jgi:hypothetical protein
MALCLVFVVEPAVCGEALFVEGTASMRLHSPDGTTHEQAPLEFTLNVQDCAWLLQCARIYGGANGGHAPDMEVSCDGTNIYFVRSFGHEFLKRVKQSGQKAAFNSANCISYQGQVFHHRLIDEVGAIWLAYASGCYFRSRTNDLVEPAMVLDGFGGLYDGFPNRSRLRAKWTISSSEPFLPERLVYFGRGENAIRIGPAPRPAPSSEEFTNAVYEVETFTNLNGLRLPREASLKLFTSAGGSSPLGAVRLLAEYRVNLITAAITNALASYQPGIDGVAAMYDQRAGDTAIYFATNGWPSVETLRTAAYFQRLREINRHPSAPRRGPWALRIVLALVVLIPIWVYALRVRSRRGQETL